MKRFALLLAFLWSAQLPICLWADGGEHAYGQVALGTAAEHHHAAHGGGAPRAPDHERGPVSCEEHCASLAWAMAGHAPAPVGAAVALLVLPSSTAPALPEPRGLQRSAVSGGQPPPDRPLRTAVLRL